MVKCVQSIQVCFGGSWTVGCEPIWVITFFVIVAAVSLIVLSLRRLIKEYMHRRTVNKWFAKQTAMQDEE